MTTSPDLGIPFIDQSQGTPEVTHNEALLLLQAVTNGVIDRGVNTPAVGPTIGDAYIIGSAPTGAWAGRANCVTIWSGTAWDFIPGETSAGTPITMGARQEGMRVWVRDEDALYIWSGSAWTLFATALVDDSVTNAKLANMATQTIKGRTTAGTGDPEDLTATQARTVLGLATTDSPTFAALTLTNGQIVFPATQVPSANANTLDDYEEGTWTPVLTFATPGDLSIVYSTQAGTYTKVGRFLKIDGTIITSTFTHSTASGELRITGSPFTTGTTATEGSARLTGFSFPGGRTAVNSSAGASVGYYRALAYGSSLGATALAASDTVSGVNVLVIFSLEVQL